MWLDPFVCNVCQETSTNVPRRTNRTSSNGLELPKGKGNVVYVAKTVSIPVDINAIIGIKLGSWEGKPVDELKTWISQRGISNDGFVKHRYFAHKWHDEVESVGEVFQRVIDYFAAELTTLLGKTVLIASHGGVLESIIQHLTYEPKQRCKVTNCGWIKLHFYEDKQFELIEKVGVYSTIDTSIV